MAQLPSSTHKLASYLGDMLDVFQIKKRPKPSKPGSKKSSKTVIIVLLYIKNNQQVRAFPFRRSIKDDLHLVSVVDSKVHDVPFSRCLNLSFFRGQQLSISGLDVIL